MLQCYRLLFLCYFVIQYLHCVTVLSLLFLTVIFWRKLCEGTDTLKNNATVIVSNGLWNQFRIICFYLSQLSFGYIDILDMWACIRNASVYKLFQYRLIIIFLVYFSTVLLICYITYLSTFYFLYLPLKWKCFKCMFQMHITSPIYVY